MNILFISRNLSLILTKNYDCLFLLAVCISVLFFSTVMSFYRMLGDELKADKANADGAKTSVDSPTEACTENIV